MNCKQGDLAIIVKSVAGNEGKIVRCIKFVGHKKWRSPSGSISQRPTWEIDMRLPGWSGGWSNTIDDEKLRPIRDSDGEDEILRIAGYPHKETA